MSTGEQRIALAFGFWLIIGAMVLVWPEPEPEPLPPIPVDVEILTPPTSPEVLILR